jgi:ADP-ribosyl-[dinitrogen reductase] hydrolase
MAPDLRDRLRATAVGAAIGDALGMPLEFGPTSPLDRLLRAMRPGRLPAGAFTDDTEMALALAESLLAQIPLNPADLAGRVEVEDKAETKNRRSAKQGQKNEQQR